MKKMFLHSEEPTHPFYVMNEYAEYWTGLRFGKARFSDNFNEAKTLERDEQFRSLQHISDYKIEKIYL
jgi:hypothetical protein